MYTEITVYSFDELSDNAKEVARDGARGWIESDELLPDTDDLETIAAILGIEFRQRACPLIGGGTRHEPLIYWGLYPSWCAYEGDYAYAKGAPAKIRAHAPQDVELHRIADQLQALQRKAFYRLTATMSERREYMSVATDNDELAELLRDFATWIVRGIEAQSEWLNSDEQIDESLRSHEFLESGRLA